ncbi:glycosyltransferase [Rothia sp. ZJ932]|uniref:glycosyltransferase n=1 Tax=Rothia sp. ZJ932 TaxID=2810516 RepID=UPI0019671959|nr:glycosyltransferase [Rothia sp. ZJ932]QRZ61133.1 glycosyltransferase [Rothia sp. ZJ932]
MVSPALTVMIGADTYPPDVNGAAQFGHRLALAMRDRGHEVHVVAANPENGSSVRRVIEDGITEHRLRSHKVPTHEYLRICSPWEIWREVGRILDEVKPDVVHLQCHLVVGRVLAAQAVRRGIRVVATNHMMPENLAPFLPVPHAAQGAIAKGLWWDMGRVLRKVQVVTTPTPIAVQAMHDSGVFKRDAIAVSNGIEIGDYELQDHESIEKNPDQLSIYFVGRLAVEKNIDVLLRAFALLPAELSHAVLEIAGDGEQRDKLAALADELGISDRVRFLGYVSDEELRAGYLRADVFCQPGTAELQSLVTLEALSASLPVVLADALALPHLVREGENGYLFEPGNARDLAEKLASILLLDDEGRQQMGKASKALVAPHRAENTWQIFESLYVSNLHYNKALAEVHDRRKAHG